VGDAVTSIAAATKALAESSEAERAKESATCARIDYSCAYDFANEVRAFAIVESGEDPHKVGDGGRAHGLLQMHPATFQRYYGSQLRFAPNASDTWVEAQIKACAGFLRVRGWRIASQDERNLIVQAWNLGEYAVFVKGRRNPEYLARWLEAHDKVKSHAC
jgi:hypothetical protein